MNDITERALLADLGRLKGAHNNAVNKFSDDIGKLTVAARQCVAEITRLQQVVAQLQQQLAQMAGQAPGVRLPRQLAAPAVPAPVAEPAQQAQVVSLPSSWPADDDEEDADVIE